MHTHTQMHKHTQTRGETETAKYQCYAAGPRRAAELRAQTHTLKSLTNAHTLAHIHTHTQPLSQLHSDTLIQRSVFWGHCLKARGEGRSGEREQRRRRGRKERKGEQNEEMEKSSTELFALLQNFSSLRSLFSIIRAFNKDKRRIDTFRYSAFSEDDTSHTWICMEQHRNGYTATEEREDSFFFYRALEKSRQILEFAGSPWVFFAETAAAADVEESGLGKRQKAS